MNARARRSRRILRDHRRTRSGHYRLIAKGRNMRLVARWDCPHCL